MPDPARESRSQLGLYRSHLTSPEHRRHITVGREAMLNDTLEVLRKNKARNTRHHQLFIAPRGSGKTHFLSLLEDEIHRDPALDAAYEIVRFPEEARRVLSFADFLLTICEVLRDSHPDSQWDPLYEKLSVEDDNDTIIDTLVPAFRKAMKTEGRTLLLMVENLNQIMEEQIKKEQSIKALRGFLMKESACLLIATSPMHFGAVTHADRPFFDFFDTRILDPLSADETIDLIRRNLEWDRQKELLKSFPDLLPRLRAIYQMTGGSPRLSLMLYELLTTESITAVKQQFLILLDRITPFYQDRLSDLSPQERAVIETIATMRSQWGKPAKPKTPGNIAERMRMDQRAVSTLLGRLTKSLYLKSIPNPADGRSNIYAIREGFFDLWLAMNVSRAARQRIPFLTDFFAAYYEQEEIRQKKRQEYWQRLKAGEFDEEAVEHLNYLSEVGPPEERAAEKLKLVTSLRDRPEDERVELLRSEIGALPLDPTGRWIHDRLESADDNYLEALPEMIQTWEEHREGGLEALAQRLHEMGEQLSYHSWSKTRMEFLRDHLASLPLDTGRVHTRLKLASFLRKFARWEEAEIQGKQAVEEAEKLDDKPLVAAVCNDYAQLLHDTKRLAEAEPLMRRALAIDEAAFGPDHPNVARTLNNLAGLLQATNRLAEAEPLMHRALAIAENAFGPDHPNVAIRLNNFAGLLQATNRLAEAEPLMRRALAIDEAAFGPDHPNVARTLNNLAGLLKATNRLAEAEPLMHRALTIDEAAFGSDHPNVAIRLNNLALLLQATKRLAEAEPLMRRHLESFIAFRRATGHEHPHLRSAASNYLGLLRAMGRSETQIREAMSGLGFGLSDSALKTS